MRGLRYISMAGVLVGAAVAAPPSFAAVNAKPDRTWQVADGRVMAIAISNGRVYIGGSFTHVMAPSGASGTAARRHLAAFDQKTGRLLPWRPTTNRPVYTLVVHGGTVYAGGQFTRSNGRARRYVAAYDATHRGRLRRWVAGATSNVRAMVATRTTLYLGGDFHKVRGTARDRLAAVSFSSDRLTAWHPKANGRVTSLALSPTHRRVYAGGAFTAIGRHGAHHLAAISLSTGRALTFHARPSYIVWGVAAYRKRVFIAGGGEGGHLTAYTTTGRRIWMRMADGDVQTVAVSKGQVFAGGHFDHFCRTNQGGGTPWTCTHPVLRRKLLSTTTVKGRLTPWDPHGNSPIGVWFVVAGPKKVTVGGEFTKWGPHNAQIAQARFAQFSR